MWSNNETIQNESGYATMDTTINNTTIGSNSSQPAKRGQNCVPVMIAHLNRYGEDLQIWGVPVRLVTLVAILDKYDTVSTKVSFHFRDETGTIRGIKWLDAETVNYVPPVPVNSYARVYGTMRNQNNENFINVVNIQPLAHLNELLMHLMEVTLMSFEGERDAVIQNNHPFVNNSFVGADNNVNSTVTKEEFEHCPSGLNNEQAFVLAVVKDSADQEYGSERNDIKSRVPPQLVSKVDDILAFLSEEGHVYTTKTDDHFKFI